jgi:hypothetical protein
MAAFLKDEINVVFGYTHFVSLLGEVAGETHKGPKLEIFGTGVFTQIRPVWLT